MRIAVATVVCAYELLRSVPPFRGWKLPAADDVEFHAVPLTSDRSADYAYMDGAHRIRLCVHSHGQLGSVLMTVAHEMCHMRLAMLPRWEKDDHGPRWQKLAKQVCRLHGWDIAIF
jgi:hypothetical protein